MLDASADPEGAAAAGEAWALAIALASDRIEGAAREPVRDAVLARFALANAAPSRATAAAFPAVAHAALARAYLKGRKPSPVEAQARLVWAVARGRV